MKKQVGFTLIELIIVIIILGILAAYAIPKYMAIDQNARISVVQGMTGAIRTASEMVHSVAIVKGASGTVNIGSTDVVIGTNKYPTTAANGINAALADTSGFNFSAGKYTKSGATDEGNCSVVYDPSTNPPTITPNYNGC